MKHVVASVYRHSTFSTFTSGTAKFLIKYVLHKRTGGRENGGSRDWLYILFSRKTEICR